MTPQEGVQIAVLTERVANLTLKLETYIGTAEKRHQEFLESNERRHQDAERALQVHIDGTLPLINDYRNFQGEWRFTRAGFWVMMLISVAVISALVIDFIRRN